MEELRNFEYRLYPMGKQRVRLENQLLLARRLYNACLEQRILAWRMQGKNITYTPQAMELPEIKNMLPEYNGLHSQVLQDTIRRLQKAYDAFFRRVKLRKCGSRIKAGFPRFKNATRFRSIIYPQSGFEFVSDRRLRIAKIGNVPIILHRVPKGEIKTMTVKKSKSGKWFVVFSCELEHTDAVHPHADKSTGIDAGLPVLATLSDKTEIPNPRYLKRSELKLKRLQRRLSRKVKGSRNRGKAIHLLAVQHEKVANQRKDFLHKTSHFIANNYGTICVENLNINGMLKNHCLAKHIQDASWGTFLRMTCYKAVSAGGRFIVGDPFAPTTQLCSSCGAYVAKSLGDRIHDCPICGLKLSRDLNASINIENFRNRVGHTRINACGDSASTGRPERPASGIAEPGTILG